MITFDKNIQQKLSPNNSHIRSLRFWALFNFWFVADLTVNPYTLTIERRNFGLLKRYLQLDLRRLHRVTPYLINDYAVLKLEAHRSEIQVAKKNPKDFYAANDSIGVWLPYVFRREEAIEFVQTLRDAIVKRELIDKNYQRFNN